MELRIQYAKTEDGVSIAYWTLGEGFLLCPEWVGILDFETGFPSSLSD